MFIGKDHDYVYYVHNLRVTVRSKKWLKEYCGSSWSQRSSLCKIRLDFSNKIDEGEVEIYKWRLKTIGAPLSFSQHIALPLFHTIWSLWNAELLLSPVVKKGSNSSDQLSDCNLNYVLLKRSPYCFCLRSPLIFFPTKSWSTVVIQEFSLKLERGVASESSAMRTMSNQTKTL